MKTKLNFFGIETTVETDDPEFINKINQSLSFFKETNEKNFPACKGKKLNVNFLSDSHAGDRFVQSNYNRVGPNIFMNERDFFYFYRHFLIHMIREDGRIQVTANRYLPKGYKNQIKKIIFKITGRQFDYFSLIRFLVIFPVFMLLEQERNIFLLHASAVKYKDHGVIFAGIGSSGKTTAALSLCLDHGAEFLTDNFLLFDENYIYPFPEYIRLSKNSSSFIKNTAKMGSPFMERFNRKYYILEEKYIGPQTRPSLLFMPCFAEKRFIKKIPLHAAMDRLLLANDHAKEFHNYNNPGLFQYLRVSGESLYMKRIEMLEKFLANVDTYEIGISGSQQINDFVEEVIL